MKAIKELRSIDYSLPMQLLQATKSATSLFRAMLHSHQLTDQQWRIIRVLAGKKNIETFELARQSMVPPPSLTRILKNFEKSLRHDPQSINQDLKNQSQKHKKALEATLRQSRGDISLQNQAFGEYNKFLVLTS